jgi:hypothetical protein
VHRSEIFPPMSVQLDVCQRSCKGVPDVAAEPIAPSNSSASGQFRTIIESLRVKEAWSKALLVGAGNVFGGIFKLAHRRRVLLGIVLTFSQHQR